MGLASALGSSAWKGAAFAGCLASVYKQGAVMSFKHGVPQKREAKGRGPESATRRGQGQGRCLTAGRWSLVQSRPRVLVSTLIPFLDVLY